jgi:hypothetical protein
MYDEHVQKVLEQVVTYGDKKFSKLGFDDVPGSTPCIEEDGLKNELLQHQCNGFQHDRCCSNLPHFPFACFDI